MRLSRVKVAGGNKLAFYDEAGFMLLEDAAKKAGKDFSWLANAELIDCIHGGKHHHNALSLYQNFHPDRNLADASFLVPIPKPNKIFLLAGNYAEHIR